MSYGWHIEQVQGGFVLTFAERDLGSQFAMLGSQGSIRTTSYVFQTKKQLLDFLATRLIDIEASPDSRDRKAGE